MITAITRVKTVALYICLKTTQALIESMEHQIEQLKDEVLKLKLKIQTFQNIIKSDILEKIYIFSLL